MPAILFKKWDGMEATNDCVGSVKEEECNCGSEFLIIVK